MAARRYTTLRAVAMVFKIVAAIVLVATILVILAIVGGGLSTSPGASAGIVWAITLGGALLVAFVGLTSAVLLYVLGAIVPVLMGIEEELRRIQSRD